MTSPQQPGSRLEVFTRGFGLILFPSMLAAPPLVLFIGTVIAWGRGETWVALIVLAFGILMSWRNAVRWRRRPAQLRRAGHSGSHHES